MPESFLGILLHWTGGLSSASMYVPYRGVRRWSWETYWMLGGVFSWIICPTLFAWWLTDDLFEVLSRQPLSVLGWTYFFGALWGFGGLTFGLTMRYLGMSLGMGMALGYTAAFGTLIPPMAKSINPAVPATETFGDIVSSTPGLITLTGVGICLLGIAISAFAGRAKEADTAEHEKRSVIKEFNFPKGLLVATFCGIMSACFAFALTAGNPIGDTAVELGTDPLWSGLPKLIVVLWGGFTTNLIWCSVLFFRNGSLPELLGRRAARRPQADPTGGGGHGSSQTVQDAPAVEGDSRPMLVRNYLLSALAGSLWYFQFFFYTMGESKMGAFGFASWTLHMASIMIFGAIWGAIFHEWRGASSRAVRLMVSGITTLVFATVVIGFAAWLKTRG